MEALLTGLKAAAESTRLRLLSVLARGELTVTELTRVLGQSQPRVSRHLKLLVDAGLLERSREGAWVFYRVVRDGADAELVRTLLGLLPEADADLAGDLRRLDEVRRERADRAAAYFRRSAADWDRIRGLYVGEAAVERAMLEAASEGRDGSLGDLVDLGTGTGRMLELFSDRVASATGIDTSSEMLNVARANLDAHGVDTVQVRLGDVYSVPLPSEAADIVTLHHVLHFLGDPAAAIAEAARLLRPGGRLLVVDFAPHGLEFLREDYAHRRLGFTDGEVAEWCSRAGLAAVAVRRLEAGGDDAEKLSVTVWRAERPADARRATG